MSKVVGYEADSDVDFVSPLPHPGSDSMIFDDPTAPLGSDGIFLQIRMLKVGKNMTTGAMIGWYCFALVFVGSIFVCLLYVYCHNANAHRRAQRALDDQRRLESIEANVARWSRVENERNKRVVRACLQRNTKVTSISAFVLVCTSRTWNHFLQPQHSFSNPPTHCHIIHQTAFRSEGPCFYQETGPRRRSQ